MGHFYFTKLSGAGNDFILFDRKFNPDLALNPQIIARLCDRRIGIGADGILLISEANGFAYRMDYFNSDGSIGSLCANGSRCSLQYGFLSGKFKNELVSFISNGREYSGQVIESELVKFNLNKPENLKRNFRIKTFGQLILASFINTGSPHVVIDIKDVLRNPKDLSSNDLKIDELSVINIGREIRFLTDFSPEGTNVNFVEYSEQVIKIRTYERGVEDETLSCGSGSVASAVIAFLEKKLTPPIKLIAKSGDSLLVDFDFVNNEIENLSITGPAKVVYKGEITI
jgi:diaminopimelate epimerase